jgi:hypothetical protein
MISRSLREMHKDIDRDIQKYGRSIIGVGGEGDDPSFAYTIGNWKAGLPELLVIGTRQAGFLNDLSEQMLDRGAAFANNELVSLGGRYPLKAVIANKTARDRYTVQAGEHFGTEGYALLQMLLADRNGVFPDEPGCMQPYSQMPVLRLLTS